MNFLETTHAPSESIEANTTIVESRKAIAKTMNEARFPKNHNFYNGEFDDGNHPGECTSITNGIKELLLFSFSEAIESIQLIIELFATNQDKKEAMNTLHEILSQFTNICSDFSHSHNGSGEETFVKLIAHHFRGKFISILQAFKMAGSPEYEESKADIEAVLVKSLQPLLQELIGFQDTLLSGYTLKSIALENYMDTIREEFTHRCNQHRITLIIQGEASNIFLNEFITHTVIENIFSNALKFTPEGGSILLTYHLSGTQEFGFSIHNSGSSIPGTTDIFANGYTTPGLHDEQGTGIGLFRTKILLTSHDQSISYKNENGGVSFYFTLPYTTKEKE